MAALETRTRTDGDLSYLVKWREQGRWQGETFRDAAGAAEFKAYVEAAGNRWPVHATRGRWIKGLGWENEHAQQEKAAEAATPLDVVFERWLKTRTAAQDDTCEKYRRIVVGSLLPSFPTIADVTDETIPAWITERLLVNKPKTIANHHGLLHSICEFGRAKGMIAENPCSRTKLPDPDDYSDGDEAATFLERDEFALIVRCAAGAAYFFLMVLVATGMRFGEITAMQVKHVDLGSPFRNTPPAIRVRRAWKGSGSTRKMGPPKSKKSKRDITLNKGTAAILAKLIEGKKPNDYVFATAEGKPLTHSNVYDSWWLPAVRRARMAGLTKAPRLHDLRHTHASWLIYGNVPLPAIQRRLGHDKITTTVDRYGHLLIEQQEDIWAAIDRFMPTEDADGLSDSA